MKRQKIIAKAQKLALKGRHSKAITEYLKLVDADPKDVRIWLRIADLYVKAGQHAEAITTYLKVAEHHTCDGFALKAIAVYRKAVEVPGAPAEIHLRLAELFSRHGLRCDAMRHLRAVLDHFDHGPVRLAALRQMVSLEPNCPAHHVLLGDAYLGSGLQPQAVHCYEKAAALLRFALDLCPGEEQSATLIAVLEKVVPLKQDSRATIKELVRLYGRPAVLLDTRIDAGVVGGESSSPDAEEDEGSLEEALRAELQGLMDLLPEVTSRPLLQDRAEACQGMYVPGAAALEAIELEAEAPVAWETTDPTGRASLPASGRPVGDAMAAMVTLFGESDRKSDPQPIEPAPGTVEEPNDLIFLDQRLADEAEVLVVEDDLVEDQVVGEEFVEDEPAAVEVPPMHARPATLTPEPALPFAAEVEPEGDVMPCHVLLDPAPPDPAPLDAPAVDALALFPEPALCAVPSSELCYQEIPWHRMDTNHDGLLLDAETCPKSVDFPMIPADLGAGPLAPRKTSVGFYGIGPTERIEVTHPGHPDRPALPKLQELVLPNSAELEAAFDRIQVQAPPRSDLNRTQIGAPPTSPQNQAQAISAENRLAPCEAPCEAPLAPCESPENRPPENRLAPSEGPGGRRRFSETMARRRQDLLARWVGQQPEAEPTTSNEPSPTKKRAVEARRAAVQRRSHRQTTSTPTSSPAPATTPPEDPEQRPQELALAMLRTGLQEVDRFLKRNLLQDAKAILEDLADVSPDDPEVEDRLAELYSRELSTLVRALPVA